MRLALFIFNSSVLLILILFDIHQLRDLENSLRQLAPDSSIVSAYRGLLVVNILVISALFASSFLVLRRLYLNRLVKLQAVGKVLSENRRDLQASRSNLISLMQDLSDEKDAAHDLSLQLKEANEELRQRNDEMEKFIYTISHDLKSPLVTIGGFSKRLANDLKDSITERQAQRFERIDVNINQMEALLDDLLNLSRVIRQDIDRENVDSSHIIAEQVTLIQSMPRAHKAKIHWEETGTFFANARLFAQCINNLLNNAVKYQDPSRMLEIHISASHSNEGSLLYIKDNGLGVAEKDQQRIFDVFQRVGISEGTGVGLSIVGAIMKKHGGEVSITSQLGHGSCFKLWFPKDIKRE